MDLWGEITGTDCDNESIDHLLRRTEIILPSEFQMGNQEHFMANPCFQSNSSVKSDNQEELSAAKSPNNSSPFFETLKILVKFDRNPNENRGRRSQFNRNSDTINQEQNEHVRSMRRSIIMILTHIGFDQANNLTIDLLVDILEYYLKLFAKLLRSYTDSQNLQSPNDFYDVLDKTLHHMNVPDIQALKQFNDEVVRYYHRMKQDSENEQKI